MYTKQILIFFISATILMSGCSVVLAGASSSSGATQPGISSSISSGYKPAVSEPSVSVDAEETPEACFFDQLAKIHIIKMGLTGKESAEQAIRAAYKYVIENTSYLEYDNPVLSGSWQYLDNCGTAPTAEQIMAVSPLLYGVGSCENYACALMLLLDHLGFTTKYVPGLTYSFNNQLVDHAWLLVNVEGSWYHLDPQLEWNIIQNSTITYKYFMKSDTEFAAHHVWGSRLANADEYSLQLPGCQGSLPAPDIEAITLSAAPKLEPLLAQAEKLAHVSDNPNRPEPASLPPFPSSMSRFSGS